MVFNSLTFLIFLGIVLLLYYRLGHRGQNWMLIAASYVFYGWWDYRFVALLLFTTFFDYSCALWIEAETNPTKRRWLLASSIAVNLGVLCIFKYFNFFAESLQSSMALLGVRLSFPMLHVVLPVGISFYTFLSMSYTIDVYRRQLRATHNPTDFMLYVAYFPHLVAGPIVRASILLPQCQKPRRLNPEEVANGFWLILLGYVKKVVIADRLAQAVQWGFSRGGPPFADASSWLVLYAFAFQIYGDFSGYSDIARGLAKLMGFELVENFRAPYLVSNPAAFWRHWHISLSTWLRDYLYIPLGGNRHGRIKTYRNLFLTMLLGGLWHGAGIAYVLWGLYHGILLACHRAWHDFVLPQVSVLFRRRGDVVATSVRSLGSHTTAGSQLLVAVPVVATTAEGSQANMMRFSTMASKDIPERTASAILAQPAEEAQLARSEERSSGMFFSSFKRGAWVVVFFHITCLGWLLFRAGSLPRSISQLRFVGRYLATLAIVPTAIPRLAGGILVLGALALFFQWKYDAMNHFARWGTRWQVAAVLLALVAIAALGVFDGAQFIYFQF